MKELLKNPMFGILLSLAAFEAGLLLQKKTKLIFLNPLLTAIMMVIAVLMLSGIGYFKRTKMRNWFSHSIS